jgi:hypothetical protein|tara:strand:+ start:507 stop:665 length:159 start_codon:yes stop_codon:yes gene_type:complete
VPRHQPTPTLLFEINLKHEKEAKNKHRHIDGVFYANLDKKLDEKTITCFSIY